MKNESTLLEDMGHHELISMLTAEEVADAREVLRPFLKEYRTAGMEIVAVLTYLFGIKQGHQDMYGENASRCLAEELTSINRMGKTYGFLEAMLLGGSVTLSILPNEVNPHPADGCNASGKDEGEAGK